MAPDGVDFRRSVFLTDNRNFGERLSEKIVAGLQRLDKATDASYDLRHGQRRCEVKSARVLGKPKSNMDNMLDRAVDLETYATQSFCSNIQHLKLRSFDDLYYVLFFNDYVLVFFLTVEQLIQHKQNLCYCAIQQRGSKPDEDGQFSISATNLQFHLRFLKHKLNYWEALHYYTVAHRIPASSFGKVTPVDELYTIITANPGLIPRDIAYVSKLSQKKVNERLGTAAYAALIQQGLVAVEEGAALPLWAQDANGLKLTYVPYGTSTIERPAKQLLIIPQPPVSGSALFDHVNDETHAIDMKLVNSRRAKERESLVKDKDAAEQKKALVVSRLNDKVDAGGEINDALRTALAAEQATSETLRRNIVLLEAVIERQDAEIASYRPRDDGADRKGWRAH